MKRLKKPAAWLTAIFLALGLATLGNLSYAAEEPLEAKKDLQAASSSENVAASEEEKPASADRPTETAESQQTTAAPEPEVTETSKKETTDSQNSAAAKISNEGVSEKDVKMKKTAASDQEIMIEGSTLYAQGTSIVIKKDSDGKAYVFDASGNSRLSDTSVTSGFTIYGGGKNKPAKGNVTIDIQNVQVSRIYGGGFSDGTGNADLSGNVSIKVSGTVNASSVYGGGYANASKGNASANVSGSVTVDIPSVPSSNHGNLYGGGYAYTTGAYNASADVASVNISVTSRTYSLRGGGYATANGDGKASADVSGSVSCTMKSVDIREVYSGGYASGANAHASCGSITSSFAGSGNEVMIFHGGGDASNHACADVSGSITANLTNCSSIYGYVTAGGTASGGGSADVNGSVTLNVVNSVSPVQEQFGNLAAAAFHTGGQASGQGSSADVKGTCSTLYKDSEIVGTIVGGGESISGGSAKSGKISFSLENVKGSEYEGTMYYGDYILIGEVDDKSSRSLTESSQAAMTVTNSKTEFLWGGLLLKGNSLSCKTGSDLIIKDSASTFDGIAHFDTLSVSHPITVSSFEPKSDGVPTLLKVTGLSAGKTAVTFHGSGAEQNWFALRNGTLNYNETADSAFWKIASYNTPSGSIAVQQPPEAPGVALENSDADHFLTQEDREKINTGSSIEIVLNSSPVSDPPTDISKLLEKEMHRTQTQPAVILDLNLMKVIDDVPESIHTLASPLRLTFEVPEEYRKENRQFQVIRIHEESDGIYSADTLNNLSTEPDKVTVETDRFSVYTLVYKDQAAAASESAVNTTSAGGDKNTSNKKNTSLSKTAIGKKDIVQKTASNKKISKSDSKGQGYVGSTANTADTHRSFPSLLLILSGSLICGSFLLKKRTEL